MDHELVLSLNEITVLMAISSVGIIAIIFEVFYMTFQAFAKGNQ